MLSGRRNCDRDSWIYLWLRFLRLSRFSFVPLAKIHMFWYVRFLPWTAMPFQRVYYDLKYPFINSTGRTQKSIKVKQGCRWVVQPPSSEWHLTKTQRLGITLMKRNMDLEKVNICFWCSWQCFFCNLHVS